MTATAGNLIADMRTGKNGWHGLMGALRQPVYGWLAGYESVDAASPSLDPERTFSIAYGVYQIGEV